MDQVLVTDSLLNHSMEIISLLTGETFATVRSGEHVVIMAPQHQFVIPERIGKQQLMQMIKKLVEQLMEKNNPSQCNSAVKEEIKQERGEDGDMKGSQNSGDTMMEGQQLLPSSDGSHPLCSRDSTQEAHTWHDQSEDNSGKVECKEEESCVEGGHRPAEEAGRLAAKVDEEETRVRGGHGPTEEVRQIAAIKEEEEEMLVTGGQQSMRKADAMVDIKLEDSSDDEDTGLTREKSSRSDKAELDEHQKRLTGERPYSCPECGKRFILKTHLTNHLKVHTRERPYPCPECGKCFIRKAGLDVHLKVHTGERPYSCPQCGKCFIWKAALKFHLKSHSRELPFSCAECGKGFTSKTSLDEHLNTHTGEHPRP